MYPEIEPYESGMLDVGDGHRIYWEVCGNPAGEAAVVLHGGPGSGCTAGARRYFDPSRYRVVLFDQRNAGRSRPHAAESTVDLSANTTGHLVADMEALREHLRIERWVLFGASWGSVLGLAYAVRFPERVSAAVFAGVATGRRAETELLSRGLGPMFPAAFERFRAGVPAGEHDLAAAYLRLLFDADPGTQDSAARAWCDWEDAIQPTSPPSPRYEDPAFRLGFARVVTHYFSNGSFLEDGVLLREAHRLAGIPCVLVQGTLDLSNLIGTPWLLREAWPGAELLLIDETGHGGSDALTQARVAATDRFADRSG
jgi:proline iminopeptidase